MQVRITDSGLRLTGPRPEALEAILQRIEHGQLGSHASAYWQHFGQAATATIGPTQAMLRGEAFARLLPSHPVYSLLHAYERWTYRHATVALPAFPASWALARTLARRVGARANYDVFRAACVLATIRPHVTPQSVAIIGDGPGFMSCLLLAAWPLARLHLIDFPPMLAFQLSLHTALGSVSRVSALTPDEANALPSVEFALNVASMQEMDPAEVARYFAILRQRGGYFYCVNRAEKQFSDGTISRFAAYPWSASDRVLVDGPCPYYTHFYQMRPYPHRQAFDGALRHRLIAWG